MDGNRLPCGIDRELHKICGEKNCYLSGEGCPVHRGVKKGIIHRLPDYVFDSILVEGERIYVGAARVFVSQ